jgi:membrane-associated phospholipid phosphatase
VPPVVIVPLMSAMSRATPAIVARAELFTAPGSMPSGHGTAGSATSLLDAVIDHENAFSDNGLASMKKGLPWGRPLW